MSVLGRNPTTPSASGHGVISAAEGTGDRHPRTLARILKDIALFFAAPFVTLAYLALFPFIAVATLRQARRGRRDTG